MRKSEYYRTLEPLNLEDISPINGQDSQPIFFEQRYVGEGEGARGEAEEAAAAEGAEVATGQHLVIFVHGFMGNQPMQCAVCSYLCMIESQLALYMLYSS